MRLILLVVPFFIPPPQVCVVDIVELNRVLEPDDEGRDRERFSQWIYRDADGTIRDWRFAHPWPEEWSHPVEGIIARKVFWTETYYDPEVEDRARLPESKRWRLFTPRPPWQGAQVIEWGTE